MKKILIMTLLTSTIISGCSTHSLNDNGTPKYNEKDQQELQNISQDFNNKGIPAYVAMFPNSAKGIVNKDKTLNSQAVINNFSKNWDQYYHSQHDLISGIINVDKKYYDNYLDKAKKTIREQELDKNIPRPFMQNLCGKDAIQSQDVKASYSQCIFFNEMLNTDRAITVATFEGASSKKIQDIIDKGEYSASQSYLSLIEDAYQGQRWYQPLSN